jgi:hypothetical protein
LGYTKLKNTIEKMNKEQIVEIWNTIPNKHKNYRGIEVIGEREMMQYFTRQIG